MNQPAARRILVIGGGFSGMSAAIELKRIGAEVDLVEIDPGWRSYGAGISIGGAALRAFQTIGVLDAFLRDGYADDGVDLMAPHGVQVGKIPTPRLAGPDVPGGGGIMRPVLARILADATRAAGVDVRLGCSFVTIDQQGAEVAVQFTDGTSRSYDLVIGADGLYSRVRQMLFPQAPKPTYTGQGVWRAVLPRAPEITRCTMWLGPNAKPGLNPVSKEEMYLFVTETRATHEHIDAAKGLPMLKKLLAPFPAPLLKQVQDQLNGGSQVVYRPLEKLLLPQPWSFRRVVLIGDAVHATTPHLASGAGLGVEDAIVLAEELAHGGEVIHALDRFQKRRWERCRMVVENSARLGEIEVANGDREEHTRIMGQSLGALAAPI